MFNFDEKKDLFDNAKMRKGNRKKLPASSDEYDKNLLANVKKHGWHTVGIEDESGPCFAYSVGLCEAFGQPEIIVVGLRPEVAHGMINRVVEQIKEGGKFGNLCESGDILNGYKTTFCNVEKRHYRKYIGYHSWFYRGNRFPVLQCVWPDYCHHYPWDPQCNPILISHQPVLCDDRAPQFLAQRN